MKDARIDLRVGLGQKALLEQAASAQGKRLSEFVVDASTEAAEVALADQRLFALSSERMGQFLAELEEPPKAIRELRALFDRKSVLED